MGAEGFPLLALGAPLARVPASRAPATDLARYTLAEYRDPDAAWLVREAREVPRGANGSDGCPEERVGRTPYVRRLARTLASVFL